MSVGAHGIGADLHNLALIFQTGIARALKKQPNLHHQQFMYIMGNCIFMSYLTSARLWLEVTRKYKYNNRKNSMHLIF